MKEGVCAGVEKEACEAFITSEHDAAGSFTPPGPGSCGGRQVPLECELQEWPNEYGYGHPSGLLATHAPCPCVTVSLAGDTTAANYEADIARIELLQNEGKPVILEPSAATPSAYQYAFVTLMLVERGKGHYTYIDIPPTELERLTSPTTTKKGPLRAYASLAVSGPVTATRPHRRCSLPGTPESTLSFPSAMAAMPYAPNGAERIYSYTIRGGEALMLHCRPTPTSFDCPRAGTFGIPLPEREPLNEWPFL